MTFPPLQVNMKEREPLPILVVSPTYMGESKKRREMTPEWKALVLSTLAENKANKRTPSTLAGLARSVGADKRGIYETFNTDQTSSTYVDAICDVLGIDQPLRPVTADEDKIRSLSPEKQAALLTFVSGLSEAIRGMPAEQQQPLRSLISRFLREFFSDQG